MTRLLIVEDEWLTAQFIADIAIELGFEIKAISQNYEESLKYINSLKIDFVILDINIKGSKTGIEIAQMLKIKKIPFIF